MIKVTKTPTEVKKDITYPCLGIFNITNKIVLFSSLKTGTVIYSEVDDVRVGSYSNNWNNNWVPYTGTITLTNEL